MAVCCGLAVGIASLALAEEPDEILVTSPAVALPGAATVVVVDDVWSATSDLGEVLAGVAGASVRRLGPIGSLSSVGLRGSSARQVQVHLDGVPLDPDGSGVTDLSELPLSVVREVRVWRGFAPAAYGASGIGGVIDLRTPDAARAPLLARASLGSFDTWQLAARGGGVLARAPVPVDALLAADLLGTSGAFRYQDDGGTRFDASDDRVRWRGNADQVRLSVFGRLRVGPSHLRGTLSEALLVRDEGLPGPIGDPAEVARLGTVRHLATASVDGRRGAVVGHGRLWHLARVEALDDRLAELGVGAEHQRDVGHQVGALGRIAAAPLPWLEVTGVVQARWEQARRTLLGAEGAPLDLSRVAVAATVGLGLRPARGRLSIDPVVDVRWLGTGRDASWLGVSPRLAISGDPHPSVHLRAQAGRYFRPPALFEVYGDRGAQTGNPALGPERGWQADVGLDVGTSGHARSGVWGSVSGFWSASSDLIAWVQNAQRTTLPVNLGAARVLGLEAALRIAVGGWLDSRTALTLQDPRITTDDPGVVGKRVPNVAAVEVDQRVFLRGTWLGLGLDVHHVGQTSVDATNLVPSAARTMVGALLRLRPVPDGPALEVGVRNLLDTRSALVPADPLLARSPDLVAPLTDFLGYPLPGRAVYVTLAWEGPDRVTGERR